jgi:DNA-directed RNA polymerase specialized sigma24 family protein
MGTGRLGTAEQDRDSEFVNWVTIVADVAVASARRRGIPVHDAADVAHDVVLGALRCGPALMCSYPDPAVYATVRVGHAHVSWLRREGVQRAEGARRGRRVDSIDARPIDGPAFDVGGDPDDTVDTVIRSFDVAEIRGLLDEHLDARDVDLLVEVKGHGVSVADLARRQGLARETVSRRVARAARRFADAVEPSHPVLVGAFDR